ncbi:MAG: thioredoxin family protein [Myxococcota bacterium]|nr:thioredoxin family protein [Myxococcota bacterium]
MTHLKWNCRWALLAFLGSLAVPTAHAGSVDNPAPLVDFSGLPASAWDQSLDPQGKPHPVLARLVADRDAVRPGESFRLGVQLQQKTNWHTYWKSPGDIGLRTQIQWSLPSGAEASDFEFPVPERFDQEGIISYGYDGQAFFFSEVTLSEATPGTQVELGAEVDWLVCEVACIPGRAELTLPIDNVGPQGASEPNAYSELFDHFEARHPSHPVSIKEFNVEHALSDSAVHPGDEFQLAIVLSPTTDAPLQFSVDAGTWPAFTPIVSDSWMPMDARVDATEGGGLKVLLSGMAYELEELPEGEHVGGLLQLQVGEKRIATEVVVPLPFVALGTETVASQSPLLSAGAGDVPAEGPPSEPLENAESTPSPGSDIGLLKMLGLAFLGGMLLNVMPCVLPVLSLKLYSLVEQSDVSQAERRVAGLAYTAGIVLSFWALAGVLIGLRSSLGLGLGWGFQFQYPPYVLALATVVFVFGLSLFGVFEVPAIGANKANDASQGEGAVGYLLTGAFATLLATPCSAPFLGTGMGLAFSLPAWGILLAFSAAGLGLAAPFLLVAFVPALFRFLPKPGAWMESFKQLLGFTLMATTVWLVDVFMAQTGREGGTGLLAFFVFVGLGAWIFGRWGGLGRTGRQQGSALAVAVVISALAGRAFLVMEPAESAVVGSELSVDLDFTEEIPWQAFSEERVASLAGRTVFIDFTADWCLTCKVNEKQVLNTETVRTAMAELGVVPLMADWTRRDEVISEWLQRFGRAGVPFYLVLPADPEAAPIALPEVITPGSVVDALRAGAGKG